MASVTQNFMGLTLVTGQANHIVHGASVSFNIRVTCTGNACTSPTGEVALQGTTGTDFAGLGGAVSLTPGSPNSTAVATTSTIPGGTYGVSARYSGDATYHANTSRSINIMRNRKCVEMSTFPAPTELWATMSRISSVVYALRTDATPSKRET